MTPSIREMTADDIPLGMRLKTQAGWNQLPTDWRRFIELEPTGCFVAQLDGQDVGTVTTCVFDDIAWLAMMLVDDNFRGQGIGKALMNHALAYLDGRGVMSVRLDATPLGQPLYEKLGFVAQFQMVRFAGEIAGRQTPSPYQVEDGPRRGEGGGEGGIERSTNHASHDPHPNPLPTREREPDEVPIDRLLTFDQAVTNTPRARLLTCLFDEHPDALRRCADGSYLTSRPGEHAVQIGPGVGTAECGPALLRDAFTRHARSTVYIDVPADNAVAVACAEQASLTAQRQLMRMTRGRLVAEDVRCLWASSGPEKG